LRKVLNDIGVLPYYTFSVKGYHENSYNFATNGRAVQEQIEEKMLGIVPDSELDHIRALPDDASGMIRNINQIRKEASIPFLATDRNVLNLPGVGKSLTYRVIGITRDGRRILEFDHDHTRTHSPIIEKMGRLVIIESKSVAAYLRQLNAYGENIEEYEGVFGYSIGETEPRMPIYEYPDYAFRVTGSYSNLVV
jgi:lysine 2,3-aminomutase